MSRNGRTPESYRKHELLLHVIRAQCHAQTVRTPGPIILIDLTAGDGKGVATPQPDLFLGVLPSRSTPEILYTVSRECPDVTLVLCEEVKKRRDALALAFPSAILLQDSTKAPLLLTRHYRYALIVSDPNGMHHNIEAMQAITRQVPRSDFVLTLNQLAINRVLGVHIPDPGAHRIVHNAYRAQNKYRWMLDPHAWRRQLHKRQVAQTRQVMKASPDFHYRILVAAHAMSDVIKRFPDRWELFK
jgi:hypothetical protein